VNNESCPPTSSFDDAESGQAPDFDASVAPAVGDVEPERLPAALRQSGRFEVRRLLGRGAFGDVYLAYDRQLSRLVAIKVKRADKFAAPDDLDQFLREARAAASLRHPGIVTVYDVHGDQDGVFIVLEFVEGSTLAQYAGRKRLSLDKTVRLMIDITQAVAYAHEQGLVHRDLKPSNILVDERGSIRITDFGLAIQDRGQGFFAPQVAGTPNYMAPEQVRGETHRLDGRTDVWSLGVIFYWLLTGRKAFEGTRSAEIYDAILHSDPRPPRQMVPDVPRELERICLKSLSKRMSDRYSTGHDMADDLLQWLAVSPEAGTESSMHVAAEEPPRPEASVIPKGLRSFDQNDADFYLSLLPGPYDRQGMPESVRFWKHQIEERDPSITFSVGLMYGPSGCGKTSLVRAGVLPRLAAHVRCVYVEAAAENTEQRLQTAIARALPALSPGLPLVDMLVALREGHCLARDEKLLIVLDQFEQWLTGRETDEDDPLVRAIRQCDGGRLQCLVMVRDDFSMAATRFMNALEVPIVERHNCAAVDVFRSEHARRVLRRFGEAFGRLSPNAPADGDHFVEQAVELLSEGNVVAPVRLAAFAELTRHDDWKAATLRGLGGSAGLGAALLEAHLGEDIVNPTHRQHREAARRVLQALLPEDRMSLKGRMRSQAELMAASGYANRPRDFETLLNMLDKELRLISPADPQQGLWDEPSSDAEGSSRLERYYQLAHDYLVPSLNAWLTAKQRETRSGRAALLLETISSEWNARPDVRRLPSVVEWISLRCWTRPDEWTSPQRRMMAAAGRRHLARLGALVLCVGLGAAALYFAQRRQQVRSTTQQLLVADVSRVPDLLGELDSLNSAAAKDLLLAASNAEERPAGERLRAQLYLARDQNEARESLVRSLPTLGPEEHRITVSRLAPHASSLAPGMWAVIKRTSSDERLLRAAGALAAWDPDNQLWSSESPRVADALARCANPYHLPAWVEALVPARRHLTPALTSRFRDELSSATERASAATALERFLRSQVGELAELTVDCGPESFPIFFAALRDQPQAAIETLTARWQASEAPASEIDMQRSIRQRAVAAIALARLDSEAAFWSALSGNVPPDIRTVVIDRCSSFGVPQELLLSRLNHDGSPLERHAALIALAEYGSRLASDTKTELIEICLRLYEDDPHPGVHSAAEWVLRRLGAERKLSDLQSTVAGQAATDRDWAVNAQGITMVIVRGPQEFSQGSPASEQERDEDEKQQTVRLSHSFAISAHEITRDQFLQFQPDFDYPASVTPSGDCPIGYVSWIEAVKFCRWLSEKEGIPEKEMCYPSLDKIDRDVQLPDDWQRRIGYRLPTEAEWECACRAGTTTARFFGESGDRLDRYAFYGANSQDHLWPVGSLRPNPWGMFDVYGNVMEWCQDKALGFEPDSAERESNRVMRGGTYRLIKRENRSAKRFDYPPIVHYSFLGLRVARSIRD
jgi:serine/threonine protein kinase/formylglycine-generating enzyme required for sulfatase activity